MLGTVLKFKRRNQNFVKKNYSDLPKHEKDKCLLDCWFLVDITRKLNELNLKLQDKEKLITDRYEDIQALVAKLKLYKNQLKSKMQFISRN